MRNSQVMEDGSLSQIEHFPGTTKAPLIRLEERKEALSAKTEALKLMRENGVFLPVLRPDLRQDTDVIKAALKSHPWSFINLSEELKNIHEIHDAYEESLDQTNRNLYKKRKLTEEMRHIFALMEQDRLTEKTAANSGVKQSENNTFERGSEKEKTENLEAWFANAIGL